MKKLWIINHYAIPTKYPGGTRHFELARHLTAADWDVTIVAASFIHGARLQVPLMATRHWVIEEADGTRFVWIRTPPYVRNDWRRVRNMLTFSCRAKRLLQPGHELERHLGSPDVIMGCSVHPLAAATGARLAAVRGVPFILELRDLWPQSLIEMGSLSARSPVSFALRCLESRLVRRADRVVLLSPRAVQYFLGRGVAEEKLVLIPNGVGGDAPVTSAELPAEKRAAEFTWMYAGAHGVAHSLDVLLEAARILKDRGVTAALRLVGAGPEKGRLLEQARRMGLTGVSFEEPVPKSMVPHILREADVLVLTENENVYGSSNKLADYLAAGRPIVFCTHSRHNAPVACGCGIAVPPGDGEALADAVQAVQSLPEGARRAMGEQGRRYAREHLDWCVLADRLKRTLGDVLAEQSGSPSS